jgi:BirA family biotin operon repressor/biotin-[acetyl-CoA-carboxylase] ligase
LNSLLLDTLFCGRNRIHMTKVDSTNTELKRRLIDETLPEGTTVTCDEQEQGRGYSGHVWHSEPGLNVMMSILLKPTFLQARFQFYLNQVVTLGLYGVLSQYLNGDKLRIKWPNDLMYKDKKICGILIENNVQGNYIQNSIVGVGININERGWKKKGLPCAISMRQILKHEINTEEIISRACTYIEAQYLMLKSGKMEQLQEAYMNQLYRVEEKHHYLIQGNKRKAKIVGLNPEGKLVLESKQGFVVCDFKEIAYVL